MSVASTHFFPPNPEKLGDTLLTLDIAEELSHRGSLVLYSTAFVGQVVEVIARGNITVCPVGGLIESALRAQALRRRLPGRVVDLQRLNCWVDFPDLREFFDEVPDRARLDWFHANAVESYGLASYSAIFRQMLGFGPPEPLRDPVWTNHGQTRCVVAPHCATDFQQHDDWPSVVAELVRTGVEICVVGAERVLHLGAWPEAARVYTEMTGQEVVALMLGSRCVVGGATGLTHLADTLGVPTFAIWRRDDRVVFGCRRASTRTMVAERVWSIRDAVVGFVNPH